MEVFWTKDDIAKIDKVHGQFHIVRPANNTAGMPYASILFVMLPYCSGLSRQQMHSLEYTYSQTGEIISTWSLQVHTEMRLSWFINAACRAQGPFWGAFLCHGIVFKCQNALYLFTVNILWYTEALQWSYQ